MKRFSPLPRQIIKTIKSQGQLDGKLMAGGAYMARECLASPRRNSFSPSIRLGERAGRVDDLRGEIIQNDPEGGIPSGSLEVLGRFNQNRVRICIGGEFFQVMLPFVSIVSWPVISGPLVSRRIVASITL
ncbi:MAG: hypothetical protein HY852_14135 [Bradyrhizobium sp.]|uniref:hypothetical protein n=1 Tax=Bradyrhizobium sp. TaxID=376 RepID=UPI0025BCBA23|nr:hypothetical protein [Bradyrhizobium sp.]MBI5262948.1 hypothetical protein [Bradyrhizobium sp.]